MASSASDLARKHLGLASTIAYEASRWRFFQRELQARDMTHDLYQEAYLALVVAAHRYDPSVGDFGAFAGAHIRGAVRMCLQGMLRSRGVLRRRDGKPGKVRKARFVGLPKHVCGKSDPSAYDEPTLDDVLEPCTPTQRLCLRLFLEHHLTQRAISEILGWSKGTANAMIRTGLERIVAKRTA